MGVTHESAFEANIEAHLLANGWHHLAPTAYDKDVGLFPDEIVRFVQESQPKAWSQLVARHGSDAMARHKFVAAVAAAIDHRGTISVLRSPVKDSGVAVKLAYARPASALVPEQTARYAANRVGVVRQLHHSESNRAASLDLALVVNGLPVATAELKNPLSGQSIEHAMKQYRTDRNPNDLIFDRRTIVHFAVDPHHVAMTTRLAGQDTVFLPFDQGSAGPGHPGTAGNPPTDGYQTAYLWEEAWQRDNWLDLLATFVHAQGDRTLFPRFHQWHAVRSIVQATYAAGAGVDRLVQHSAGSGKSNTIAWTAHSLSRLHGADDAPIFDKVVVITDRRVLDQQLQETVAGLDHTPGTIVRIDESSAQLKTALEGNAARIIITTLQKFPVVAALATKAAADGDQRGVAGRRFAIIVDEAHSSTSGSAVTTLKSVLAGGEAGLAQAEAIEGAAEEAIAPDDALLASAASRGKQRNLSFFAFTATPKPKTLDIFGELGPDGVKRPFHTYSMRQAIAEGFILDVLANYTTYGVYYKLANASPRKDPELDTAKGRASLARFASLHPYMLDAKAEVIIEHFRQKSVGKIAGQAKAMVVTRSRLHAVRTKQALDAYIAAHGYDKGARPLRTLVAFSGGVTDPDAPEVTWTEPGMNGFAESQLPEKFHADDYQVLVVAEKYQTGFDEPLLHTMYVDKKLAGVKAVQTLSRLNRMHPGKENTFILDFANSVEEIQAAFEPFFEQSLASPTDPNLLYAMEHDLMAAGVLAMPEMEAAVAALLDGANAKQSVIFANLNPAVGRFLSLDPDAQESFRGTLDGFIRGYGFVAQIMSFIDTDLERLYLYGRLLLADLPARAGDPMPQVSKTVQLTHLRIAVTADAAAIVLVGSDEPGVALPGEGRGPVTEPELDRLSALIATMNERFGADLGDADRVWFQQQWTVVMGDDELRTVAQHNDRSQFELILEQKIKDLLVDRHEANDKLFDLFFSNPQFQVSYVRFLASTYDEFRAEAVS